MERILSSQAPSLEGKAVKIAGWVQTRRDHGKLIFLDIRDREGIVQVVCTPKQKEAYEQASRVRPEWVLEIEGTCQKRPQGMETQHSTGAVEVTATQITILAEAITPPFPLDTPGYDIDEEKRLHYRYLDLRRERLSSNLKKRSEVVQFMRQFLFDRDFIEVETPLLTKSTPEGARDFVVPSRLYPGKFYALPQSPQQYKQLLQVAGVERYFQIARALRDEDPRADRQAEHTQLDVEMSFVEREDVLQLIESLYTELVSKLFEEKKVAVTPFPRLSYEDAIKAHGNDRPDLRRDKNDPNELAFCFVLDFPAFEWSEKDKRWDSMHNPFSKPQVESAEELKKDPGEALSLQYDLVLNGQEIAGGSIRASDPKLLEATFEIMGYTKKEIAKQFGHMLEAFAYGVPPHGGIAGGIDRVLAILLGEPNIREVIAFPKTGDSKDPMMNSPSEISQGQLKELGIKVASPPSLKLRRAKECCRIRNSFVALAWRVLSCWSLRLLLGLCPTSYSSGKS